MTKTKVIAFFLLIISGVIIFWNKDHLPAILARDEADFRLLALLLIDQPYTPYSLLATGHSTLYFYIIAVFFKFFGISQAVLRLPSAIFGFLSVATSFFIFNLVYKNNKINQSKTINPAIFSGLLGIILVSLHWFINFTRLSYEATFLFFLETISFYYILRSINHLKYEKYIIISGVFAGLTYNSYTPGRIFFILPLCVILLTYKNIDQLKLKLIYFFIPLLLIIFPLTQYLMFQGDSRIAQQSYIYDSNLTVNKKVEYFTRNIISNGLMFNIKGDVNGRHNYPNKPALNPIIGLMFLAGLALAIKNYKLLINKIFLLYFIIALIPSMFTYPWENPNMLRTFTVILPVIYFIGLSINRLLSYKKYHQQILLLTLIVLSLSRIYELRTYFVYQALIFQQPF